jgi:hypothetical protein
MNKSSVMATLAMALYAVISVFIPKAIKAKIKKRKDDDAMDSYKLRMAVAKRERKANKRVTRA